MANEIRDRNWILTVNQGAKIFETIESIIIDTNPVYYALILHDRDNEKQPHYHAVIKYRNAIEFSSMQRKFDGAHIEKVQDINASTQYLLHLNNPEKEQYQQFEITTNNKDLTSHYLSQRATFDKFNPNMILDYIQIDRTKSYWEFVARFGLDQVRKYRLDINELAKECQRQELGDIHLYNDLHKNTDNTEF